MSEPRIMIVSAIDEFRTPDAVPIDADCGHRAWISPSGLLFKLGGGVLTRCTMCVDPNDVTEIEPVPGSRDELRGLLGKQNADELLATAQADPGYMVRALQRDVRRKRSRRSNRWT